MKTHALDPSADRTLCGMTRHRHGVSNWIYLSRRATDRPSCCGCRRVQSRRTLNVGRLPRGNRWTGKKLVADGARLLSSFEAAAMAAGVR